MGNGEKQGEEKEKEEAGQEGEMKMQTPRNHISDQKAIIASILGLTSDGPLLLVGDRSNIHHLSLRKPKKIRFRLQLDCIEN